jgi:hypothetical protein
MNKAKMSIISRDINVTSPFRASRSTSRRTHASVYVTHPFIGVRTSRHALRSEAARAHRTFSSRKGRGGPDQTAKEENDCYDFRR